MSKRLLVVGLDGAEWDLIRRWTGEGKLPTFKRLVDNGAWGLLRSTIPATPPAWTSAFTGVNPGKHNIFDFFTRRGYDLRLVSATDRKAKAVWEILSEKGLKVIVVNVPMTYPPDKVNGVMISGVTLGLHYPRDCTFPREIGKKLDQIGYIIDAHPSKEEDVQRIFDMIEKRRQVVVDLLKSYDWDLFVAAFMAPDRVQHFFWRHMNGSMGQTPYKDIILKTYEALDEVIEELLELIGKDTNVIIFSDHGFGPLHKIILLNNWFKDLGLLQVEPVHPRSLRDHLTNTLKKIVRHLPYKLKTLVKARRRHQDIYAKAEVQTSYRIDWSKTKVWLEMPHWITINLRGRQPLGIVEPGEEYENLRNYIIQKLYELRDPDTGEKVIRKVNRREDIYWGPYAKNGPDLQVKPVAGYVISTKEFEGRWFRKPKEHLSASHREYGVFIAYGPDIKASHEVRNAEIVDIAPTILHMMGMFVPRTTDGKVLKEIFRKESDPATRTIQHEDFEEEKQRVQPGEIYTKKEEEEIKERLRRLGYL
jgi:predicted AlkP superfamily phosphohydrolase/phosphomutase